MTPVSVEIAKPEPIMVQEATITPRAVIEAKIRQKFGVNADKALKVAECESGLNPLAMNENGVTDMSYGLYQVNLIYPLNLSRPSKEWLLNADNNIEYAYKMSGAGANWQPWSCKKVLY